MPKVQFSDVTPPERRSIRNIPVTRSRRKPSILNQPVAPTPIPPVSAPAFVPEKIVPEKKPEVIIDYYPKEPVKPFTQGPRKSKKKSWLIGSTVFALLLVFVVGMMTVFASATINITPKSQEIEVDTDITAVSEPQEEGVPYQLIKLSKSKTVPVPAGGEEAVELKASGKIVIYNNFSTDPQRLIIRTRFESPEGLIYRIPESIVIPGKTVKNGVETPGSIEVEVFADEAGEKYNIKKTDFTIPGFKTDAARYKAIYARSSTNMAGGFIGKRKTVLPADKQAALQNIDGELEAEIKKELESKLPAELVLLSSSISYKSTELPPQEEGSSVLVGKEVSGYAVLLNKQNLSKQITDEYIAKLEDWNGIKPIVKDFSRVSIKNLPANIETGGKISLELSGKAKVWADIDTDAVNQKLLGAPKKAAASLIDQFPGISSVTAAIRPIWKQSFPDNPSKIYVYDNISE